MSRTETVPEPEAFKLATTVSRDGIIFHTIFTWGYGGENIEELDRYVRLLGAQVADIRYSPNSWNPTWRAYSLSERYGTDYHHIKALGNINYKAPYGGIRLAEPSKALPVVSDLLLVSPIIFLCACKQWSRCHRHKAAELMSDILGVPYWHLPNQVSSFVDRQLPSHFDQQTGHYHVPEYDSIVKMER